MVIEMAMGLTFSTGCGLCSGSWSDFGGWNSSAKPRELRGPAWAGPNIGNWPRLNGDFTNAYTTDVEFLGGVKQQK